MTADPNDHYGQVLKRLANSSRAIVVMMESIANRLVTQYRVPRKKIVVIPHGVPDLPFNDTAPNKRKRQLGDRLILFGEWCAAQHSLDYETLPDWFLAFDGLMNFMSLSQVINSPA